MKAKISLSTVAMDASANYARALIEVDAASQVCTNAETGVERAKKARDVAHVELMAALFEHDING